MNEVRNTFNSIAGRPKLMTSIWCRIGIHRWQKWSDIKEINKTGYSTIFEAVQDRYCESCNKYQRKVLP